MRKLNLLTTCVLLAGGVMLSGCADWERHVQSVLPEPKPAYADKQINVAPTRSVHEVGFADRSAAVSADERAYLQYFLNTVLNDRGQSVMVEQPGRGADRLTRQRAQSLVSWLAAEGYHVARYDAGEGAAGKVRVAVDHLMAVAPNCPNWEFHRYETFGSQTSPNFGCSDRSNLAAMVANPRDLVSGQVPSLPQGHPPLASDIRYRNDNVRQLEAAGGTAAGG